MVLSDREKQDRLDRMREKIGSLMKEKEDDEDERIKKAQKEMDEKTEREFAMKLQKQQQRLREMGEHRVNEVGRPTDHGEECSLCPHSPVEISLCALRQPECFVFHLGQC